MFFIKSDVPAVQFLPSAHEDNHRLGDVIEKTDSTGFIKVAAILKDAAEYLSNRVEPLTSALQPAGVQPAAFGSKPNGIIFLKMVPSFSCQGEDARISDNWSILKTIR